MNSINRKKFVASALAIASLTFLSGCGAEEPTPPIARPITPAPGGLGSVGCVPISSPSGIGFTASNLYFSWSSIIGGDLPMSPQTIGQVTVAPGTVQGGAYQNRPVPADPTTIISMNITPTNTTQTAQAPYPGYPNQSWMSPYSAPSGMEGATTANATGVIKLSPIIQSDIASIFGGGVGTFPGLTSGSPGSILPTTAPTNTNLCVSGIALNLGRYYNTIYGAEIYLYMNNTQSGYILKL